MSTGRVPALRDPGPPEATAATPPPPGGRSTADAGDPVAAFEAERSERVRALGEDDDLHRLSLDWLMRSSRHRYTYNFSWLGRPVIQLPQDLFAVQEIMWRYRPDLVVETGIAHGGSLLFWSSVLQLIGADGRVVGIDVEIRPHNRRAIEAHPLASRITMIEGSSTDRAVIARVSEIASRCERVMVLLDSNHSHRHVLDELRAYGPMVTAGGHLVVFDTVIEDLPAGFLGDPRWDRGDNPKTAVRAYLRETDRFEIDRDVASKVMITVAPDGYLLAVK